MTIESETLFVVGESDELVCLATNQAMVISGLKDATVSGWKVSMTNDTLTILELLTSDVDSLSVASMIGSKIQYWVKFDEDRFLPLMKLRFVEVNVEPDKNKAEIYLEFSYLPVTFEQAVSISLAQKAEDRPRKSFAEHKEVGHAKDS